MERFNSRRLARAKDRGNVVHRAKHVRGDGSISPLCKADAPQAIDLAKESWTLRDQAVTCTACRQALNP